PLMDISPFGSSLKSGAGLLRVSACEAENMEYEPESQGRRQSLSSRLGQATLECSGSPRCRAVAAGKRRATPVWLGQRLTFLDAPGGPNPDSSGCQRPRGVVLP